MTRFSMNMKDISANMKSMVCNKRFNFTQFNMAYFRIW